MAEKIYETQNTNMKEILESTSSGSEASSSANAEKLTTWQMVLRHRGAILWSAFVGLAGINWGMDVLVSLHVQL